MTGSPDLIFTIHGSNAHAWWRRLVNGSYPWWRRWSLFNTQIRSAFGKECEIREFHWSSRNTDEARLEAGMRLAHMVQSVEQGRKIHLIGHSHGGNVALIAINNLPPDRVESLFLLSNPNMSLSAEAGGPISEWLYWGRATERVRRIFNLYSPQDFVQCRLVRIAHGLSAAKGKLLAVQRTYTGAGHEQVVDVAIPWRSRLAAHRAMHCGLVGTMVGSLLAGNRVPQAIQEAHLDPEQPNTVEDRGGWPGTSRVQQMIFERGDPLPFDINPASSDVGILFVHGFTASPAEMRPMAQVMAQESGWRCKGILLPGHGGRIEDMRTSGGRDWLEAVEKAYLELRRDCARVFLAGLSMGGVLCCHIGLSQVGDPKLGGIILMAPAFTVSNWRKVVRRLLLPFARVRNKGNRAADYFLDHRLYSYLHTPLDKAGDVLKLGRQAMQTIGRLHRVPVLLFAGDLEATVSLSAMHDVADRNHWIRMVRLPQSRHILPLEPDRDSMFEASLSFVKECLMKPVPPDRAGP